MSGPSRGEAISFNDTEEMATYKTVRKLRSLADYVDGEKVLTAPSEEVENSEHIAELLRMKADKIEASLRVIEKETQTPDFKNMLKAIQWTQTGDYGPESIQDAWDDYADEVIIKIEK